METAKQKAIREAYGEENWKIVKDYINENGWCSVRRGVGFNEITSNLSWETRIGNQYCWRPKSLQGIENNNGWVEVNSDKDLPAEITECHVITIYPEFKQNMVDIGNHKLTGELVIYDYKNDNHYTTKEITHYQPIIKPEPPIY